MKWLVFCYDTTHLRVYKDFNFTILLINSRKWEQFFFIQEKVFSVDSCMRTLEKIISHTTVLQTWRYLSVNLFVQYLRNSRLKIITDQY